MYKLKRIKILMTLVLICLASLAFANAEPLAERHLSHFQAIKCPDCSKIIVPRKLGVGQWYPVAETDCRLHQDCMTQIFERVLFYEDACDSTCQYLNNYISTEYNTEHSID